LGIEISDDHIQQYRQIQKWRDGWKPERDQDGNDKREKYKLTIERRLDKKHFDAVFRRVTTFVENFASN